MNQRSKACDISPKVRAEVMRRDNHRCVYCNSPYSLQIAHVWINRSHGGLGVKENLVTLCIEHHMSLDNGRLEKSKPIRDVIEGYMRHHYGDVDLEILKYKKEKL